MFIKKCHSTVGGDFMGKNLTTVPLFIYFSSKRMILPIIKGAQVLSSAFCPLAAGLVLSQAQSLLY